MRKYHRPACWPRARGRRHHSRRYALLGGRSKKKERTTLDGFDPRRSGERLVRLIQGRIQGEKDQQISRFRPRRVKVRPVAI